MNKPVLFALTALVAVSCVSKKKYAELQAEMEQMQTMETVNTSLQSRMEAMETGHQMEIKELQRQLEETHMMLKEKDMELHAHEMGALSPEERQRMEEERRRQQEMEMQRMHENPQNQGFEAALAKSESEERLLKSTLEGALQAYSAPKVLIEKRGSRVVLSVQDDVLFTDGNGQVSAGGETFINRVAASMKVNNDLEMFVIGIADAQSSEAMTKAMNKAGLLASRMAQMIPAVAAKAPLTGAKDCAHSFSERTTNCDRVEIVFAPDYEAALDNLRMTE